MTERVATTDAAAAAFRTLADAEGAGIPMYARLCRSIADAPAARRRCCSRHRPVNACRCCCSPRCTTRAATIPTSPLAAWYPSVGGDAGHDGDLDAALHTTVAPHRRRVVDRLRHRQVQTNEVNRCVAWRAALAEVCADDDRPLALVELGASAGLNLGLDRFRVDVDGAVSTAPWDRRPRRCTSAPTCAPEPWPALAAALPPVVPRVGIDQRPLDPTEPDDARWLTACVWPEQPVRLERLRAALERHRRRPADAGAWRHGRRGRTAARPGTRRLPRGRAVVVGARLRRPRRAGPVCWTSCRDAAGRLARARRPPHAAHPRGRPPVAVGRTRRRSPRTRPAEIRHASLLSVTSFDDDGVQATRSPGARPTWRGWTVRLTRADGGQRRARMRSTSPSARTRIAAASSPGTGERDPDDHAQRQASRPRPRGAWPPHR